MPISLPTTRTAVLFAAVLLTTTAASGGCGGPAKTAATAAAKAPGCPDVTVGDVFVHCCKVGTSVPKLNHPGRGVIGSDVGTICKDMPEVFDLDVQLNWFPPHESDEDSEVVDYCYDYDPADALTGKRCTVAASCKPGTYYVTWKLSVDINGATATAEETGRNYRATFPPQDCGKGVM